MDNKQVIYVVLESDVECSCMFHSIHKTSERAQEYISNIIKLSPFNADRGFYIEEIELEE